MTMKKVLGCIRKADEEFNLIQDGDKVCVGVSGGKDSMLLLYCLSLYKKFATVKFDVIGVHIEMGFPNMDFSVKKMVLNFIMNLVMYMKS